MSVPSVDDLKRLSDFCKTHGISRLKAGDVEMEFGPPVSGPITPESATAAMREFLKDAPTDEQMLFWSTYQAVKDAQKQGESDGS